MNVHQPENLQLPGLQCGHEWKIVNWDGKEGWLLQALKDSTSVLEIQQEAYHSCSPNQGAICYCSKWRTAVYAEVHCKKRLVVLTAEWLLPWLHSLY